MATRNGILWVLELQRSLRGCGGLWGVAVVEVNRGKASITRLSLPAAVIAAGGLKKAGGRRSRPCQHRVFFPTLSRPFLGSFLSAPRCLYLFMYVRPAGKHSRTRKRSWRCFAGGEIARCRYLRVFGAFSGRPLKECRRESADSVVRRTLGDFVKEKGDKKDGNSLKETLK